MLRQIGFRRILPGLVAPTIQQRIFGNSEPGAMYAFDKANQAALFQDDAWSVPVTALEQTVGSFLDLSGRDNHAKQSTVAARCPWSARVNNYTYSECPSGLANISTYGGLVTGATLSGYAGAIAFGHGADSYAYKSASPLLGVSSVLTVIISMDDGSVPVVTGANSSIDFWLVVNGNAVATASVTALGGGRYRVSSFPIVITGSNSGVVKYAYNSSKTFKVTAYDIRPAIYSYLPYQRVNTAIDYDDVGFPHYLAYNGTSTFYQTAANIDLSSTDKITIGIGARKTGDASQIITEFSAGVGANAGSFYAVSGANAGYTGWTSLARGSAFVSSSQASGASPFPGQDLAVITSTHSISGNLSTIARNGVAGTNGAGSKGTGNFGNYPLYIGARAGPSLFFNGNIHGLILRGADTTAADLYAMQRYLASLQCLAF